MALTWSSPALLQIDETICGDNCDISGVSEEEASWIVGIFSLVGVISGPITGMHMGNLCVCNWSNLGISMFRLLHECYWKEVAIGVLVLPYGSGLLLLCSGKCH